MGSLQAVEMAALTDRNTALRWHLQSNHFPPIHAVFIPVAEQAIDAYNADEPETPIEMPNGVTLTAGEICLQLHLDPWLYEEEFD